MDYQKLLAGADEEAREDYDFDPRVAFQATSKSTEEVVPHHSLHGASSVDAVQSSITELTHPDLQETLTLPVQQPPEMTERKRIVIIDSSQRDWTVQPDAYSNIFSFGSQLPQQSDGPQVPYYFNNPTIPLSAWETPLSVLVSTVGAGVTNEIQTVPNKYPQPFPAGVKIPSYVNTINQGLVYPSYGWKLVYHNGILVHSPTSVNYADPNTKVYFYPTFNAANPAGAQVGIDIQPKRYGLNTYSYATQLALSNVSTIKLIRAILPVRGTQPYIPTTFTTPNIEYPLSLHSQPYILMTIQNLKGNYLGGSQLVQNSFTVLTQNTRNFYEGSALYPAQFTDYYPWEGEAYEFDPPLAKLSNANIQLFNPAGNVFSQLDNLSIVDFVLDTVNIGKVKFFVTQTLSNTTFGDCNAFLSTEIRTGDEITFYTPALTQIASDASSKPALTAFMNLMSNNFLVTDVCGTDFTPRYTFPFSSVGTSFTAVPKLLTGYAGMSNAVSTICGLIHTLSHVCLQQYGGVLPSGLQFASSRTFSQDYVIPMMNLNAQATFVLEMTTMEPDTTNIQKIIPN